MSMAPGGRAGPSSDINITPMIDILLVLLIIFMVVQQGLQTGLSVQIPPIESEAQLAQSVDQIVLEVEPGAYLLNQRPIAAAQLEEELRSVFKPRPRKVIFIKGAENVRYGDIARVIDVARSAGIDVVGLVPRTSTTQ